MKFASGLAAALLIAVLPSVSLAQHRGGGGHYSGGGRYYDRGARYSHGGGDWHRDGHSSSFFGLSFGFGGYGDYANFSYGYGHRPYYYRLYYRSYCAPPVYYPPPVVVSPPVYVDPGPVIVYPSTGYYYDSCAPRTYYGGTVRYYYGR